MVLIDDEYIKEGKKVTAHLLAAFRYGREDLDVLGLTFRKDLISMQYQVYPQEPDQPERPLTRLQERLKRKLGGNAYPFWFEIAPRSASSVTLQPAPGDTGKPCGVDYELKTMVNGMDCSVDKPKKHNSVRLAIRKLTYAPWEARSQPMVEVSKEFMMSPGLLHMEASLDKEMYYHGESIAVNVHLQNNSNKTVKKMKVSVIQVADICLFTTASYTCEVAKVESNEGFPVGPGATLSKVYSVCPLLRYNKDKRGLALDGQLKHEDTNLASSTIFRIDGNTSRENLGIVVQYKVKIKASIGGPLGGDLTAELPFTLTHAKPAETPDKKDRERLPSLIPQPGSEANPLDIDLIQLNDEGCNPLDDDDFIFEDFARTRMKGGENTEDHPSPSTHDNSLI
ncbi:hypothetical protein WR25_11738 [Diploscapter pachys]|uniref:Arrestin C-terminal-like domain-containing protein n=1 Tax=Diploscapter pachys TaxID=2018661 RepID=A0A2A2KPE6_9BILA|nr:hypothetical protein WR25_11738 [Diploscapter pachys]